VPSAYRLTTTGQLNYQYTSPAALNILGQGGTLKAAAFQTLLPTTSPNYDLRWAISASAWKAT
jgi:hypothetical protein